MEIKKGLSFSQAKENIKKHRIAFFGVLLGMILLFIALVFLAEKHILSERMADIAAKSTFLGVAVLVWRVIKGDFKKKK